MKKMRKMLSFFLVLAMIGSLVKELNKDAKTVKRWIKEFDDEYEKNDAGEVFRKDRAGG